MNRYSKLLLGTLAGLALAMPCGLPPGMAELAPTAVAAGWQTETYGVYFSQSEAQEVANAINAGNDRYWRAARVYRHGSFRSYSTWRVVALHYTN